MFKELCTQSADKSKLNVFYMVDLHIYDIATAFLVPAFVRIDVSAMIYNGDKCYFKVKFGKKTHSTLSLMVNMAS